MLSKSGGFHRAFEARNLTYVFAGSVIAISVAVGRSGGMAEAWSWIVALSGGTLLALGAAATFFCFFVGLVACETVGMVSRWPRMGFLPSNQYDPPDNYGYYVVLKAEIAEKLGLSAADELERVSFLIHLGTALAISGFFGLIGVGVGLFFRGYWPPSPGQWAYIVLLLLMIGRGWWSNKQKKERMGSLMKALEKRLPTKDGQG